MKAVVATFNQEKALVSVITNLWMDLFEALVRSVRPGGGVPLSASPPRHQPFPPSVSSLVSPAPAQPSRPWPLNEVPGLGPLLRGPETRGQQAGWSSLPARWEVRHSGLLIVGTLEHQRWLLHFDSWIPFHVELIEVQDDSLKWRVYNHTKSDCHLLHSLLSMCV